MLRVGFTGSRCGMTEPQLATFESELCRLQREFGNGEFHHGDCVGADAQAHTIAAILGFEIHCHPPSDPIRRANTECDVYYEAKPYRERNRRLVRMTDFLFATPKSVVRTTSGGTWYTYNHAMQQGTCKRAMLIYPDGTRLFPTERWLQALKETKI